MSDGAPFLADVVMGVVYLIGLLTVLAGIWAAVAAAFRYADRDVEERVGQALDLEDPDVQAWAVDEARRREWRP
jgi:hypothetical protein